MHMSKVAAWIEYAKGDIENGYVPEISRDEAEAVIARMDDLEHALHQIYVGPTEVGGWIDKHEMASIAGEALRL